MQTHFYFVNRRGLLKASLRPVAAAVVLGLGAIPAAASPAVWFNPRFLSDDPASVADLSRFSLGEEVPPGTYRVDIFLNGSLMSTRDVTFVAGDGKQTLSPCLTTGMLRGMGVREASTPDRFSLRNGCRPLAALIPGATTHYDVSRQRLDLTVPQAAMQSTARGYIPPGEWDEGIPAGLLNYTFTGNRMSGRYAGENYFLNLQSGLNAGPWRLRDNSSWMQSSQGIYTASRWQHINTWVERDIIPWRSRLIMGDASTPADVFDSVSLRGIQLLSDEAMLPDSQRGFAPVIHGIAQATSTVTVKQNGYQIYQTTVPPGPFNITDLYPAGNSGDLQVTLSGPAGSRSWTVPWSTVPGLQREGFTKYALSAGEYRSGLAQQDNPSFVQGTVLRGLPYGWTAYGGTQLSANYHAYNLGLGKNMGRAGALSVDITHATAVLPDGSQHQGQSLHLLYNKSLTDWGTSIQLAGYRYSTQGFFTLADTAYGRMSGYSLTGQDGPFLVQPRYTDYYDLRHSPRGRVQLSLSQQAGSSGSLYLSGSTQSWWGTSQTDRQLQAGVSATTGDVTWNLSYSLIQSAWMDGTDRQLAVSLSVPLSHWLRPSGSNPFRNARAGLAVTTGKDSPATTLASLSGTLLQDDSLSYSLQQGASGQGAGYSGNASLSWRTPWATPSVGYSQASDQRQLYYTLSGGMVAHSGGLTLSQPLGDTLILVNTGGAGGIPVGSLPGIRTDYRGYAVIPYASDYRENRVALDVNALPANTDVDDPVSVMVPTHGAVVRADFRARVGLRTLMTLTYNGRPVPFGASAHSEVSGDTGIVGDNGEVYLSGLPPEGTLHVQWGKRENKQCHARYRLGGTGAQPLVTSQAVCR
ncbi:fimbria/pilus outer membrane usher protein [Pantoea dispersa]|uniref:fimbria/pilus outer membrane usher protein n=1 Tax=Pantoea dispersa TaxID=59814 RepID=UPI0021AF9476|nr:fimbria/pilus outer membrane usher protein [Pantoea dispersa]MCT6592551.1 fimbria/pilus outer membrane usher protein [Pantoea dispersa]